MMHYDVDEGIVDAVGSMHHHSSGRLSSTKELISPGSKHMQIDDHRGHLIRHKHEDGKFRISFKLNLLLFPPINILYFKAISLLYLFRTIIHTQYTCN